MAYFLLYRHATLVLEHLPKHPQAKNPKYESAWIEARKALKHDLAKLENLKPAINQEYERYVASLRTRALAREAHRDGENRDDDHPRDDLDESTGSYRRSKIDMLQDPDLAVEYANLEVQRRLRTQGSSPIASEDDINMRLREIRMQIDRASTPSTQPDNDLPLHTTSYSYPEVPGQHSFQDPRLQPPMTIGPRLPPKDLPYTSSGPPLPSKEKIGSRQTIASTISSNAHQFASTALLESGLRLRTMFLPLTLRQRFVSIAGHNTRLELETLGILTGALIQDALFITKLVIPEQISTSDTCEMVDELALFEWTTTQPEDLMVLGWIHTHPTQTCFLSSRDLHTHFPFQATLAESVAIVCAPSYRPDYGVYRLTDPPGLPAIKACRQTATFHPHEQTNIYTDALGRPGHVVEHADLHFEVVDLRPKK